MIRKLTRQGNSLALVIDRTLRELMEIDADTSLSISVEGRRLIVEPVTEQVRAAKFKKAVAETKREYGTALRNLAK